MMVENATSRFSDRVENYVRYRPGYPPEVIEMMQVELHLGPSQVIADIASGTGIWTRSLLENGNRVFATEPNAEMRQAGERFLAGFSNFTSVAGTAEATTLEDRSVDFVTSAQAAHWFDAKRARQEFVRILKPRGWLVLLWNERRTDASAFLREYEQLLCAYGTDYQDVRHEKTTSSVTQFFDPAPYQQRAFAMRQEFEYAGLEGRLLSSSYAPGPRDAGHAEMLGELRRIFDARQSGGKVAVEYDTRVFFGRIAPWPHAPQVREAFAERLKACPDTKLPG
jgi:ubiquinone/menaquinone biosynthesis C-methylase UbiE